MNLGNAISTFAVVVVIAALALIALNGGFP